MTDLALFVSLCLAVVALFLSAVSLTKVSNMQRSAQTRSRVPNYGKVVAQIWRPNEAAQALVEFPGGIREWRYMSPSGLYVTEEVSPGGEPNFEFGERVR